MDQSMVENCVSSSSVGEAAACAPPPIVHRRPRVREVSSRFMSPAVPNGDHHLMKSPLLPKHQIQHAAMSTSSTLSEIQSNMQRSSSANRQRRQLELGPLRFSDDNRPASACETPLPTKQRPPVKSFKENGLGGANYNPPFPQFAQYAQKHQQHHPKTSSRPDTPMAAAAVTTSLVDRTPRSRHIQHQRSTSVTPTAAAKLLQSSGMSSPSNPLLTDDEAANGSDQKNQRTRCISDVRSSMPEADLLPTVSNNNNSTSTRVSASPCSRSLTFPLTSSDHSSLLVHQNKASLSNPYLILNAGKTGGGLCLPPVPPCVVPKLGSDLRKAKKVSSHPEDVHSLKVLHNRHLQWRYANARAEASMRALQRQTERTLYSLAVKIADLYDSVKRRRMELGLLRRTKTLSTILETQIPYLDQWCALEEDYSIYLAEATQALLNASAQLPTSGNVRADVRELTEALNSAREVMEIIVFHVQRSMPKAEETENLISELARVLGGEKSLIEECGNLLSKTYTTQVEEWSFRGQIIQLKRGNC